MFSQSPSTVVSITIDVMSQSIVLLVVVNSAFTRTQQVRFSLSPSALSTSLVLPASLSSLVATAVDFYVVIQLQQAVT